MVTKFELKALPHSQPYKVPWVNSASIDVKERSFIPIQFVTYSYKIWYDVVTIDVGHIILGRSWLYDLDVTIYGCSNFCSFIHDGKKVKLVPIRHASLPDTKRLDVSNNKKALNILQCLVCANLRN